MAEITTLLFDLDGTLADTARDLNEALNAVLAEERRPPLALEQARPLVSTGSTGLLCAGFGEALEGARLEALRQRMLAHYGGALCVHSRLFDGTGAALEALEARGLRWGVVTNKPAFLSEPLLAALGLAGRAACIVSGDTTAHSKPHPLPLQHACAALGCEPGDSVYVGDCENDVIAARRAGMKTLVALYGYIGDDEDPRTWNADGYLDTPGALMPWLEQEHACIA